MAEDRLGFIGLGTMGMPMSLNILDAGKALTVWGRNREKLQDALGAGATWAQSPKAMAESCDVIFLCVFDTAAVEEVVFGSGGIAEGAGGRGWGRIQSKHRSILAQAALLAEESGV